ncbi:hypothetical protein PAEPH01_2005 [Pancytospora epiphaga]|nr:hypothetical protein PAEPH01_2005 [Pancytospora epiphaga]
MKEIVMEEEEEEAVVYKKVFKNAYKKERAKRRLVFADTTKGRRFKAPKGRGKILCLDKRMKHDLRIEKQRSKSRR